MRSKWRSIVLGLGLAMLQITLGGCVSSNSMAIGEITYPPRPTDYIIEVYLSIDAPVAMHKGVANAKSVSEIPSWAKVIGRVDTVGAPAASWGKVINNAKRRARTLGGDGLVIGSWGSHVTSVDSYGSMYYGKNVSMQVIRYHQ